MNNILIRPDQYKGKCSYEVYKNCAQVAHGHHEHWVDGIPVRPELAAFVQELRAQARLRGLLVYPDSTPACEDHNVGYRFWNRLSITYPDTPNMRVGWISFFDGSYIVDSPKIENERFSIHSRGYTQKKSKDLAKMVKVARQYLKPLQFSEIEDMQTWTVTNAAINIRDTAKTKLRNKLTIIQADIASEIDNMIAAGYMPLTGSFKGAVELLQTEGVELRRLSNYKPRTCFLWSKQNSLMYKYSDSNEAPVEITNLNDLPENLRNKLAMLNIAEEGSAIPDVGVRCANSCFWVFV